MLSAITSGLYGSVSTAIVMAAIGAAICFLLARRAQSRAWSWAGLGASLGAEASVTLLTPGGGFLTDKCVVNHDFAQPFHTDQGLLNLVLFVPVGFFAVLAIRAVAPTIALVVVLPLATELIQCLVPAVGRLCDTSDVEMNALGGLAGAAVAGAILRLTRTRLPGIGAGVRRTVQFTAGVLVVTAVLWTTVITEIPVDATSLQLANGDEKAAARQALHEAFGDRYSVVNVQVRPGTNGAPTQLLIALKTGFATLTWPDSRQLVVSLESSATPTQASFPVASATQAPASAADAQRIATHYAQAHYLWGLRDARPRTYEAGDHAQFGWIVSWRRRDAHGVLMPMRLDVQIDRAGRVSQLLVRHVDDPAALPPVTVSQKQAKAIALADVDKTLGQGVTAQVVDSELLAVQRKGQWRAQWLFAIQPAQRQIYIDATTGKTEPAGTEQQSVRDPGSMTDTGQGPGEVSDGPPPDHN